MGYHELYHLLLSLKISSYLFSFQCQLNKDLLQLFIHKVDTKLFKSIFLNILEKIIINNIGIKNNENNVLSTGHILAVVKATTFYS